MRLIDADYLKELINDFPEWNKFNKNRALKMISNAPTINSNESRKSGEWISTPNEFGNVDLVCSECNEHYYPSFTRPIYPFCPWCGAYMNGGAIK